MSEDIRSRIIETRTSTDAIFYAEKSNLDKSIALLDLLIGVNFFRIDAEAVEGIEFKERSDGADVHTLLTGSEGGGMDKIDSANAISWGLSREGEVDRIISSVYLAFVGLADKIALKITERNLSVSPNHYVAGEEIHNNSCSVFGLSETKVKCEKEKWKYFRLRFHSLRIAIAMDIEDGFIHNSSNCDLDFSKDGNNWYHLTGECYDQIPTIKMFAPKNR